MSEDAPLPKRFLKLPAFCSIYETSRATAYREARAGRLRLSKIGTQTRVHIDDAEEWARARRKAPAAQ